MRKNWVPGQFPSAVRECFVVQLVPFGEPCNVQLRGDLEKSSARIEYMVTVTGVPKSNCTQPESQPSAVAHEVAV